MAQICMTVGSDEGQMMADNDLQENYWFQMRKLEMSSKCLSDISLSQNCSFLTMNFSIDMLAVYNVWRSG